MCRPGSPLYKANVEKYGQHWVDTWNQSVVGPFKAECAGISALAYTLRKAREELEK